MRRFDRARGIRGLLLPHLGDRRSRDRGYGWQAAAYRCVADTQAREQVGGLTHQVEICDRHPSSLLLFAPSAPALALPSISERGPAAASWTCSAYVRFRLFDAEKRSQAFAGLTWDDGAEVREGASRTCHSKQTAGVVAMAAAFASVVHAPVVLG